eukprot:Em0105g8a
MGLREDIIAILDEIQDGLYKYQKSLKSMRTLHDQHVYKREPAVERVVDFVCKFAIALGTKREDKNGNDIDERSSSDVKDDETVDFLNLMVLKLVGYHEAQDKAVRFRVCQIINKMLSLAAQEKVRIVYGDALLTVPAVRVHAVQTLGHFQSPEDKECPAISTLLNIVRGDSSADVRKSALQAISVCERTLPDPDGGAHSAPPYPLAGRIPAFLQQFFTTSSGMSLSEYIPSPQHSLLHICLEMPGAQACPALALPSPAAMTQA